jgi:integrase
MRKRQGRARPGSAEPFWSAKENRFVVQLSLGFDDGGKRVRSRLVGPRGDKSEEARLGLRDRAEQARRKHPPRKRGQVHSRQTLGEYLDQWMTEKKKTLSTGSVADYEWAIESHIKPGLGEVRLRDLERKQVRAFFDGLTTLSDRGGKHKVYTTLRAALQYAVDEDEVLASNPAARLFKSIQHDTRLGQQAAKHEKGWTPRELKKVLRTAKTPPFEHYLPMVLTMFGGALGQAECFGLQWENLNLQTGLCTVKRDLVENEGHLSLGPLKEEDRWREFIVPAIALHILRERHKLLKPAPSDFMFTTPDGSPIRRTNFGRRVWYQLVKKAKVRPIPPHKMRRNTGSYLISKNKSPGVVHQVLGHANYQTTAKYYVRQTDESRKEVAATINAFLRNL